MTAWVTAAAVAPRVGVAADDTRLPGLVAASDTFCKRQRPDLPNGSAPPADVAEAAILYAVHLFRRRSGPSGGSYDELGAFEGNETMTEVYRLLGSRRPVAR